eukprot:PhF_6_TR28342/c0_g1_i1/m.42022
MSFLFGLPPSPSVQRNTSASRTRGGGVATTNLAASTPPPLTSTSTSWEYTPSTRKLTTQNVSALTKRLYTDGLRKSRKTRLELENKYYQEAPPRLLSTKDLSNSIERLYFDEIVTRDKKRNVLREKYLFSKPKQRPLEDHEIEASVQRIFTESIANREHKISTLEAKYNTTLMQQSQNTKRINKEDLSLMAQRLSAPKKKEYTVEEVNEILGLK